MRHAKNEKELVLNCIQKAQTPLTITQIKEATQFGVDNRTVQRWLNQAAKQGDIIITGEKKGRKYSACSTPSEQPTFDLIKDLPESKKQEVMNMLKTSWTHNSTALEGNTLTLGETEFVLNEGLTISGKPLKDHKEVVGHAAAIDLLYTMLNDGLTIDNLKKLHSAVQTEIVFDIEKPQGDFKSMPNGTYLLLDNNDKKYHAYSTPFEVPKLMSRLVEFFQTQKPTTMDEAIEVFAKVHIVIGQVHPFWDGNGRIARLVGNLGLLRSRFVPIVIPASRRFEYITILSTYSAKFDAPSAKSELFYEGDELNNFIKFCKSCYAETLDIIKAAK
ncbi:MAG: Fic family protein [Thalassotalea sp.]|nr:Fic family protein [Thalassotalea sp.]